MLLDCDRCFLDCPVHLGIELLSLLLGPEIENRKHFCIIILDPFDQFDRSLVQAFLAVKEYIVMGCDVVIDPPGKGVFFRGAGKQQP